MLPLGCITCGKVSSTVEVLFANIIPLYRRVVEGWLAKDSCQGLVLLLGRLDSMVLGPSFARHAWLLLIQLLKPYFAIVMLAIKHPTPEVEDSR